MKKALITGIGGQDGSYLAEHLLSLGYRVYGLTRWDIRLKDNIKNIADKIELVYGDLRDKMSIDTAIQKAQPDEIYNLAGQVFVPQSWTNPDDTFDINVGGLSRILKAIDGTPTKVYQASSSEMFGNVGGSLNEFTKLQPVSPYGVSKLAAHELVRVYRQKGNFVVSGILFNHESPRRGPEMVTRKITLAIAAWKCGARGKLRLGNLNAKRDWGFAGDYVKAMHLMLQNMVPDDYVVGTGEAHSVLEFIKEAAKAAELSEEFVFDNIIKSEKSLLRENEIHLLLANYNKANTILGWKPETSFSQLVKMMVDEDVRKFSAAQLEKEQPILTNH